MDRGIYFAVDSFPDLGLESQNILVWDGWNCPIISISYDITGGECCSYFRSIRMTDTILFCGEVRKGLSVKCKCWWDMCLKKCENMMISLSMFLYGFWTAQFEDEFPARGRGSRHFWTLIWKYPHPKNIIVFILVLYANRVDWFTAWINLGIRLCEHFRIKVQKCPDMRTLPN